VTLRTLSCAVAAAAVAVFAASPAPAAEGFGVVEAGGATFPERAVVVTLPADARLMRSDVAVRENGERVTDLRVTSVSAAHENDFAVVLAIDTSNSMRGKPIQDAMLAARAFAARRVFNQKLAVVTFDGSVRVRLPLTGDPRRISAALAAQPHLSQGTRVFDGVDAAVRVLAAAKVASGAVVVLSDGADTGSTVKSWQAALAARDAHVRVFAVGLRSKQFDGRPLESLATSGGGTYTEADTSGELLAIYEELGSRLSNQYLLRYRSLAGPDERVRVVVAVAGAGTATTGYRTPALDLTPNPPYHESFEQRFWASPISMLLAVLMSTLLIVGALTALVRRRNPTLRRRMAEFVSVATSGGSSGADRTSITAHVFRGAERSLARMSWWPRFKEELDVAKIRVPAAQIVVGTIVGTVVAMWLLAFISGSTIFAVLGLGVPIVVRGFLKAKLTRVRNVFAEQLADNLQVCASALRAGHSLMGALSVVVEDSAEPSRSEFRRVVADEQLGVPLEDALGVVVRRMANRELEQVALVASLQRESGGNAAEVLEKVTDTIRDRSELRRLVKGLTAQGRMSRWVLTLLPVGLVVVISLLNPDYIAPLFEETLGRVMLVTAAVMVVTGSLVIKRIVDIKV